MPKKLTDLYQRLVASTSTALVVVLLIFFSFYPAINVLIVCVVAALAGVGVWEYARLVKAKGLKPAAKLMVAVAVCEVCAFYVSIAYPHWSKLALLIIILGFISFFIAHFKSPKEALLHVAVELFGVCYLAVPLSFMVAILHPFSPHILAEKQDGRWWLFYLIAVTKVTDIGGYFVGKLLGKTPLAPQLSPHKTVEGAWGGFLSAVVLSVILARVGKILPLASFNLSLVHAIWMGMIIGVLAQVGDLAESLLKRDAAVKDSNSLPGVGGVLDLLDSLLFTTPVVYFFMRFWG